MCLAAGQRSRDRENHQNQGLNINLTDFEKQMSRGTVHSPFVLPELMWGDTPGLFAFFCSAGPIAAMSFQAGGCWARLRPARALGASQAGRQGKGIVALDAVLSAIGALYWTPRPGRGSPQSAFAPVLSVEVNIDDWSCSRLRHLSV